MAKKIEIDGKSWGRQTITNRFMFYKIFTSDHELCRRLLEILLGLKISRIKMPEGEKGFESDAESHSIRVDIFTEDGGELGDRTSKIFFNAEMYGKIKGDEELRALLEYFFSGRAESGFTSSLEKQVGMARRNTEWRHGYMTIERMKYYAERRAAAQGFIKGAAKQKAEDEKILAKMAAQKDREIQRLMAKVAELESRK